MPLSKLELEIQVVKDILARVQSYASAHPNEPGIPQAALTPSFPGHANHINHMFEAGLIGYNYGYNMRPKGENLLAGLKTPQGWAAAEALMSSPHILQARDPLRGLVRAVEAAVSPTPPTDTRSVPVATTLDPATISAPQRPVAKHAGILSAPWVSPPEGSN